MAHLSTAEMVVGFQEHAPRRNRKSLFFFFYMQTLDHVVKGKANKRFEWLRDGMPPVA